MSRGRCFMFFFVWNKLMLIKHWARKRQRPDMFFRIFNNRGTGKNLRILGNLFSQLMHRQSMFVVNMMLLTPTGRLFEKIKNALKCTYFRLHRWYYTRTPWECLHLFSLYVYKLFSENIRCCAIVMNMQYEKQCNGKINIWNKLTVKRPRLEWRYIMGPLQRNWKMKSSIILNLSSGVLGNSTWTANNKSNNFSILNLGMGLFSAFQLVLPTRWVGALELMAEWVPTQSLT